MGFDSPEMYTRVGGCSERTSEESAGKPDSTSFFSQLDQTPVRSKMVIAGFTIMQCC